MSGIIGKTFVRNHCVLCCTSLAIYNNELYFRWVLSKLLICVFFSGDVVAMYGYVTFTSSRSMEVEVIVEYESIKRSGTSVQRAVDAFFTYVAIDKDEKSMAIPQLKVRSYYVIITTFSIFFLLDKTYEKRK